MRVIEHWYCHNHLDWQRSENLLQQIKNHFNKGHYIENDIESKRHDGRKTVHVITNKSNRQKTASADSAGTSDRSAAKVLSCLRCGASFESLQVRKCLESSSSYDATVLSFCVGRASNSRSSFFLFAISDTIKQVISTKFRIWAVTWSRRNITKRSRFRHSARRQCQRWSRSRQRFPTCRDNKRQPLLRHRIYSQQLPIVAPNPKHQHSHFWVQQRYQARV